ncbi:hypothetical protein Xmau_04131 [Xenorhabdus mauleonii]|uniref:Uncharacterized protein n=1 Tax=Xenorhabdus mauleonii TaxID=351675 RepID=A0A1I3WAG5_9GAMM|nr:hypothetical protein [Xenorhabdus mauleonii]PHM36767.1 hypothetical protein Xmau_04131 [Xenorhabdus mauleonii]SFK04664.1 hypothetical protein SAMN05421680_12535 [Xenorhabdus mauleonii]
MGVHYSTYNIKCRLSVPFDLVNTRFDVFMLTVSIEDDINKVHKSTGYSTTRLIATTSILETLEELYGKVKDSNYFDEIYLPIIKEEILSFEKILR